MKKLLLLMGLVIGYEGNSQCPFTVQLTSSGNCPRSMLILSTTATLTQIVWLNGPTVLSTTNSPDGSVIHTGYIGYYATEPGDYKAVLTDKTGCTVTTPIIVILPAVAADVAISATATTICEGSPITFTANPGNGGVGSGSGPAGGFIPSYQWQLNKTPTGTDSSGYTYTHFNDGDTISCVMTNAVPTQCVLAKSNSIPITVKPAPHVDTAQALSFTSGQRLLLDAGASGLISSYTWSPAAGLSDTTIEHPVASPSKSILYTLKVLSPDGCGASGTIALKLFIPIRIPSAFSPNRDGKNDILYIAGDPAISRVNDFAIYSRGGQKIFQVHDAPTGDPAFGWNGSYKGHPAPSGTYVYTISVQVSNGISETLQGTVLLIR